MFEAYETSIKSETPRPRALKSEILKLEDDYVLSTSDKIFLLISTAASIALVSAGVAMHVLHRGSIAEFSVNTLAIIPLSTLVAFSTRNIVLKLQRRRYEFLGSLLNAVLG
jgi:Ca2+/H+ antiporter